MMIEKGENKKSMAYLGNIVAFIKVTLESTQKDYPIFNYADKPDFSMKELTLLIENKMKIKSSKIKRPYYIGMA